MISLTSRSLFCFPYSSFSFLVCPCHLGEGEKEKPKPAADAASKGQQDPVAPAADAVAVSKGHNTTCSSSSKRNLFHSYTAFYTSRGSLGFPPSRPQDTFSEEEGEEERKLCVGPRRNGLRSLHFLHP